MRPTLLLAVLAMAIPAAAQDKSVVLQLAEGRTFFLKVRVVGSTVTVEQLPVAKVGSTNTDPPVIPAPTGKVAKAAAEAYAKVKSYPRKTQHGRSVAGLFRTFAEAAKSGQLSSQSPKDVNDALSTTAQLTLGPRHSDWKDFFAAVGQALQAEYGASPSHAQLAAGYESVAAGMESGSGSAAINTTTIKTILTIVLGLIDKEKRPKLHAILTIIVSILPAKE